MRLAERWARGAWSARGRVWLDAVNVDQLDAALRGLAIGIVLLLSLVGYHYLEPPEWVLPFPVAPAGVAVGLALYNIAVVLLLGVPWRRRPGFALFVLDWGVVSGAILLTGGFYSPFLVLYYALVIGAALRLDIQRTLILVGGCSVVYALLSRDNANPPDTVALHLPWLVVGVTSLGMVALTAVALRRVVEVENARLQLEQQTARRLTLLNELTRTVLSATPDSAALLRTVAAIAPHAVQADCGLAVLLDAQGRPQRVAADQGSAPELGPGVLGLVLAATLHRTPIVLEDLEDTAQGADLRACLGRVQAAVCTPLLLDGEPAGALIVGSYTPRRFSPADVSLLDAIGQQIALSVRLARLYDLERDKAARSEAREQVERDLLNMVSHELRTPLTAIKTGVSGLLAGSPARSPAEARLLQTIDRSTERLILLVNDSLDMARLRAGRVSLACEQLDLAEVVLDVVATVRPLAEAKGQTLTVDLPPPGAPIEAPGDRRRVEQVLLNLLQNAHKYTPAGGQITAGAYCAADEARLWVRDTGPGIAPADQDHIFERFYVVSGAARADATGLGLAIARSLVELHGGQIGVESRPGAGSLFYFTLPAALPPVLADG